MNTFNSKIWYDMRDNIVGALESLAGFNALIAARQTAGYERDERMETWFVLGRYMLDACGNVGVAQDFIPADRIPNFPKVANGPEFHAAIFNWQKKSQPDVLTQEEIDAEDFSFSKNKRPFPISVSFGMNGGNVPPENILCPVCRQPWTIETLNDVLVRNKDEAMPAGEFVGKTFEDLMQSIKNDRTACSYFRQEKKGLYDGVGNNNKFKSVPKDYILQEGDEVDYYRRSYYHKGCLIKEAEAFCKNMRKLNGEGYHMRNLAGEESCDPYILLELDLAGIDKVKKSSQGEVPYSFEGELVNGSVYRFHRAWYYWIVDGPVPLSIARKMYEDEEGVKSVRVAGHCGCPPPEQWATPSEKGEPVVTTYHIDTWQGLKLFADSIRSIHVQQTSPAA